MDQPQNMADRPKSIADTLGESVSPPNGRMKSLADVLGVADPTLAPENRTEPDIDPDSMSAKQFATAILTSRQYRESLLRRIIMDELPPGIEAKLMDYAWGKPVDRVEVEDKTKRLEDYSVDQLEERALYLAEVARRMRRTDGGTEEEEVPTPAVH